MCDNCGNCNQNKMEITISTESDAIKLVSILAVNGYQVSIEEFEEKVNYPYLNFIKISYKVIAIKKEKKDGKES